MSRNFGIMSSRPRLGGTSARPAASIGSYAPSNSILIPSSPTLESSDIPDTLRDIVAVGFAFLFVSSVGIGFAFSLFCLFFVDLR